jgi:hypothetical protein
MSTTRARNDTRWQQVDAAERKIMCLRDPTVGISRSLLTSTWYPGASGLVVHLHVDCALSSRSPSTLLAYLLVPVTVKHRPGGPVRAETPASRFYGSPDGRVGILCHMQWERGNVIACRYIRRQQTILEQHRCLRIEMPGGFRTRHSVCNNLQTLAGASAIHVLQTRSIKSRAKARLGLHDCNAAMHYC